jgi:hypothetical protein
MALTDDAARYNRRGIMAEAWRLRRSALGPLTFAEALRVAWARAREARGKRLTELRSFERFSRAPLMSVWRHLT